MAGVDRREQAGEGVDVVGVPPQVERCAAKLLLRDRLILLDRNRGVSTGGGEVGEGQALWSGQCVLAAVVIAEASRKAKREKDIDARDGARSIKASKNSP